MQVTFSASIKVKCIYYAQHFAWLLIQLSGAKHIFQLVTNSTEFAARKRKGAATQSQTHSHVFGYNFHAAHAVSVSATSARRNEIISAHIMRGTALNPQIKVSLFGVLLTLFVAAAAKRRLQSAESHDIDEARQVTPCANTMQFKGEGGFAFLVPPSCYYLLRGKGKQYIN